jgi:flagellin
MSRINSYISGIEQQLLYSLAQSNVQIVKSAVRMATGHKINQAGDDPSAFVQLSSLQTQLSGVSATLNNIKAADGMVSEIKSALTGYPTQLNIIRTELLKDVNHTLTPDQRATSQSIIDNAISQINVLAGTLIGGKAPLSGSGNYTFTGLDTSKVADLAVSSLVAPGQTISGTVPSSATQARLTYTGNSSNQITDTAEFTLTGDLGSTTINVTATETLADAAASINDKSYLTGVTASIDTVTHELYIASVDYGSKAKAEITVSTGDFVTTGDSVGTNGSAVINGQTISADSPNANGNRFTVNQSGFIFQIEFQAGFTGGFSQITVSGGTTFALSTDYTRKSSIGIPGMYAAQLGGSSGTLDQLATGGSLSGLGDNTAQAIRVVDEAQGKVTQVTGNVTGFYASAVTSASDLMSALKTTLEKSIDGIDKTNDTEEQSRIAYYQALADNAVSSIAILDQQRASIVNLLQYVAGMNQTNN